METPIVITGFMAAGKTAVASALARALGCGMIDLDELVTRREGRAVHEIIEQEGESRFREIESLALRDALRSEDSCVIALGGGTWTLPDNRALVEARGGMAVWLDAPFELCWKRIEGQGVRRPLAPDIETARELYEKRRSIYALAKLRVEIAGNKSIDSVVEEIMQGLSSEATE